MKTQRTIAVIMILGGSVLTAFASKDIAFPAILCMLGLLGMHRRFTWDIRPERRFIPPLLLLLLAILFALHCRYAHVRSDQAAAFAWQTIARYFLASMILVLFLRSPQRLPPSLGLFHLATAMAAGQVLLLDDRYIAFRLAELLSVTLVVLYATAEGREVPDSGRPRPGSRLILQASRLVLLVLTINIGWMAGSLLYRHVESLNVLPAWLYRDGVSLGGTSAGIAHVGFSTSGTLSSILAMKEDQDLAPVLTIAGDRNPVYLRARAYEGYSRSEWSDLAGLDPISPERSAPFGMYLVSRMNVFRICEGAGSREVVVRHELTIADAMFTPLGTNSVEAPFADLMRDEDDIIAPPHEARGNLSYRVTYTPAASGDPPRGAQGRQRLKTPLHLDPRVHQLANRIFAGCSTTAEKVEAVVNYFHANYAYSLGVDVPPGQDKLTYFLLEASTGYCEYFASGAAILLRLADVPTRYVTGFLVTERGEQPGTWIARNMDAHAWVEAWDEQRNEWTIVEATVQENLGDTSLASQLANKDSDGRMFLAQFVKALYDYGLFGVLAWLATSYSLVTGVSISLVSLAAAASLMLLRRHKRSRRCGQSGVVQAAEFQVLHRMLRAMDRKVRAGGLRRDFGETLHAFSDRVRTRAPADGPWHGVADWYCDYAELRYCGRIYPDRLHQLQQRAQNLRSAL